MCGLDPRHTALTGSEMRECWVAAPQPADPAGRRLVAVGPGRRMGGEGLPGTEAGRQPRTFVPVEPSAAASPSGAGADADERRVGVTTDEAVARAAPISPAPGTPGNIPGTWWLWGDPEPWPDL
jgi:hypothetical protein